MHDKDEEKHKPGGLTQEQYEMKAVLVEHAECTLPCHVEKMIPHDQTWTDMSAQKLEGQYSQSNSVPLPASHRKPTFSHALDI